MGHRDGRLLPKVPRLLIALVGFVVLASACGSDDPPPDLATGDEAAVDDGEQDGGEDQSEGSIGAADCPAAPFAGELSRTALPDLGHTDVALTGGDVLDAAAFALGAGFQYTVYVASFEIDDEDMGTTLTAPSGEVLVTFAARGEDGGPIEPGVVYDETFVIIDSGGGAENRPVDPTGTVEFIALSDDHICLEIDFIDENQIMTGTVSARVAAGL